MTDWINSSSSKKESITLDALNGFEFEKLCGRIFNKLNYGRIENTQYTGDMGRDILIHSNEGLIVVECKHQPRTSIGRPIVQKLHSAVISSNGVKGILITTGKFSAQAVEHAKILTPPIELIDRYGLIDLATQANIELILDGEGHSVLTYSISSTNNLNKQFANFVDSIFKSYPEKASKLFKIENRRITMYSAYLVQYDVDATFKTSVGILHKEYIKNGKIFVERNDNQMLKDEIVKHISSLPLSMYDESNYYNMDLKKVSFYIDANSLKTNSKEHISDIHTKTVTYCGKNNQQYTKLCKPGERSILITDTKQVYVPFQQIDLQALNTKHEFVAVENSNKMLCYTKMFNCSICGGYIKNIKVLCNSCGAIVHNRTFFDSHSFKCGICGKTICRKCTYKSGFQTKVCKECALESGRELKPLSMKMNQRIMLGFLLIFSGSIGVLFDYILLTYVFIIMGISVILLNRKSKTPPYEYI
jgi:hypothetical protein